mmetsp:Transcript_11917/g.23137  ORF Transcript_11917/g.23137 Transcript_11917/m.23137 type:complete len:214 (+) Transcript_11917:1018-1659(+)
MFLKSEFLRQGVGASARLRSALPQTWPSIRCKALVEEACCSVRKIRVSVRSACKSCVAVSSLTLTHRWPSRNSCRSAPISCCTAPNKSVCSWDRKPSRRLRISSMERVPAVIVGPVPPLHAFPLSLAWLVYIPAEACSHIVISFSSDAVLGIVGWLERRLRQPVMLAPLTLFPGVTLTLPALLAIMPWASLAPLALAVGPWRVAPPVTPCFIA